MRGKRRKFGRKKNLSENFRGIQNKKICQNLSEQNLSEICQKSLNCIFVRNLSEMRDKGGYLHSVLFLHNLVQNHENFDETSSILRFKIIHCRKNVESSHDINQKTEISAAKIRDPP